MQGFDPKFVDFPDYIIGVTKEIWEDRGIGTLNQYYAPDIVVRSPASVVVGNQGIIAATMATLAEFPDRTLLGEDVIWCEAPNGGLLSSHRLLSEATHVKEGAYGAPAGTRLRYRIIADCHAIDNQINDEWLIRDQGAIVRQLGLSPKDYARDLIAKEGGPARCVEPYTPANDVDGPYQGRGNDHEVGARLASVLERMMAAEFSAVQSEYDRAAMVHYPRHYEGNGWGDVDRFWLPLRSSFPSARFEVHHVVGRDDEGLAPRAAVRWSLDGVHDGWGRFGAPTAVPVHVMGITHAEFGPQGIRREWTLIDETAIWKQILLGAGDV